MNYTAYIVESAHERHQVFGFRQWVDLLKSLPCRQLDWDVDSDKRWSHGTLIADCATIESARKVIPDSAKTDNWVPWPDTLPRNCELWILYRHQPRDTPND